MKRVLSGIKPSGQITLGNYLGAMKRWAEMEAAGQAEYFYFVPNLHALTVRQDPRELAQHTVEAVAWLLALGIDYRRSTVYVQSQVPAHSELAWILDNYVTMGELTRMTQFKDKSRKGDSEGQLVGLFNYPALMAADILLYDTDEVPVGDDQKQHVELARDIAARFNNLYGLVFRLPQATIQDEGARIMDLQDPSKKMSKSDGTSNRGCVFMTDTPKEVAAKFKRAVTDSGDQIKAGPTKPALTNLLTIYALLADQSIKDLESRYKGVGYGQFKADLAELAADTIGKLQSDFEKRLSNRDELISIIEWGGAKANDIASQKLALVKAKLGLL